MMDLPQIDRENVDGYLTVSDQDAVATARELAIREGILAGFSTGANVAAALRLAKQASNGAQIVSVACDSGMKYLSTDLFFDKESPFNTVE